METPLHAHSPYEVDTFFLVTPCPECGKGPWRVQPPTPRKGDDDLVTVRACCQDCQVEQAFVFDCPATPAEEPADAPRPINPTDEPSEIIDLGQWMGLFYHYLESASSARGTESRRLGYLAAMCLAEALKFFGADEDVPPAGAFVTEASRTAFAKHPEQFARQRLRDMQAKLPSLESMRQRLVRDAATDTPPPPRRKWWQFWKSDNKQE